MFFEDMLLILMLICSSIWVSINIPQPLSILVCFVIGFLLGLWRKKIEDERNKK